MNSGFQCEQCSAKQMMAEQNEIPFLPFVNQNYFTSGSPLQSGSQNNSRPNEIARLLILPANANSELIGEIPLYYEGDNPELFLGKVVKSVAKAAQKAVNTVSKTVDKVKKATGPIGSIMGAAWNLTPAGQAVLMAKRGFETVSAVARGERIDRALKKAAQAGIADLKERMKFAEMVAPFVPGIGTGVAAALGAANALAAGKPITEAVLSAARSAIPGGKLAQTGFDVAVGLAKGKNLTKAALDAARAQLPGGKAAQAAFDAGLALAEGKKMQHAAFAAAGRLMPASPYAADALAFARSAASGRNIQQAALSTIGQRVLQGKKVDTRRMSKKRELEFEYI